MHIETDYKHACLHADKQTTKTSREQIDDEHIRQEIKANQANRQTRETILDNIAGSFPWISSQRSNESSRERERKRL